MSDAKYRKEKNQYGFYEVFPKPNPEDLKKFYRDRYFQNSESASYAQTYTDDEKKWFEGSGIIADYIFNQSTGKKLGRICDVGCGEGFFSAYFFKKGWDVKAFDFSSFGVESQNPELVPCLITGDIYEKLDEALASEVEGFDLVNLSNVLEHVVDPVALITRLKKLLKPGGLLRICVPNDFSEYQKFLVDQKMVEETWFTPPEHLNYFTVESFRRLFSEFGFKEERVFTTFPIEFFLANSHSNYWIDRKLGKNAHFARVKIDNWLLGQGVDGFLKYYEASANAGLGRDIVGFFS